MFDTIAAVATGGTNQALSIIRISGPNALSIVKKISKIKKFVPSHFSLTSIFENKNLIDKVVILIYKSPNSYTGEDTVEIIAHGGVVNTQRILKIVLTHGARIANPGEFSLRAVLNGKINLIEAEGINNLIHAQSLSQAKIASKNLLGKASKIIQDLKSQILQVIGIIETNIDYPEYDDIEILTARTLLPKLKVIKKKMNEIIEQSTLTSKLFQGIKVAIVGLPNAGKSSLLNSLLNEERAIVTKTPGTTRDVVEGSAEINGVLFHFFDTAGIRNSKSKIESLGIEKTYQKIEESDLVLYLVDPTKMEDIKLRKKLNDYEVITVYTKSDIQKKGPINISAKNNELKLLIEELSQRYSSLKLNNTEVLMSTRQQSLLDKAMINIDEAIKGLEEGNTPDVVIIDIESAWGNIANILGESHHDELLTEMFSTFCLGK